MPGALNSCLHHGCPILPRRSLVLNLDCSDPEAGLLRRPSLRAERSGPLTTRSSRALTLDVVLVPKHQHGGHRVLSRTGCSAEVWTAPADFCNHLPVGLANLVNRYAKRKPEPEPMPRVWAEAAYDFRCRSTPSGDAQSPAQVSFRLGARWGRRPLASAARTARPATRSCPSRGGKAGPCAYG
jgi:hypothetical protein